MIFLFVAPNSAIPWTDIVQAIAAALVIPTAIWGIVKIFKKDKERSMQIGSLVAMAEEAKAQTEVMLESNQLQNEFNVKLAELISSGQKAVKIQEKQAELIIQQRKIAIKPRIIGDGGGKSGNQGHFKFKNIGGECKIIELTKGENNKVVISGLEYLQGKAFETGASLQISWTIIGNTGDQVIELNLVIADIEGNKYGLNFIGRATNPKISELKEIIDTD